MGSQKTAMPQSDQCPDTSSSETPSANKSKKSSVPKTSSRSLNASTPCGRKLTKSLSKSRLKKAELSTRLWLESTSRPKSTPTTNNALQPGRNPPEKHLPR